MYFTDSDSSLNTFLVFEITFFTERYLTYFYLQNTFYSSPKSSYADVHLGTFLLFSFLFRICNLFCNSELRLNCAQNKTRKGGIANSSNSNFDQNCSNCSNDNSYSYKYSFYNSYNSNCSFYSCPMTTSFHRAPEL